MHRASGDSSFRTAFDHDTARPQASHIEDNSNLRLGFRRSLSDQHRQASRGVLDIRVLRARRRNPGPRVLWIPGLRWLGPGFLGDCLQVHGSATQPSFVAPFFRAAVGHLARQRLAPPNPVLAPLESTFVFGGLDKSGPCLGEPLTLASVFRDHGLEFELHPCFNTTYEENVSPIDRNPPTEGPSNRFPAPAEGGLGSGG
jgi:hypothetical protein